jgi:hypothetical protein
MSGKAIEYVKRTAQSVHAQPGLDSAVQLIGIAPTYGSCLLYGDSGLPNQFGPISPDKIVFRDGWQTNSAYLLLNLRFTGWHRYKATNTITMLYQEGPLVVESQNTQDFTWLPAGRRLYRDKRIPREKLNGFQIPRTGISKFIYSLSGFGGPWQQDPPFYADVAEFDTSNVTDKSITHLNDWHGWTHTRQIIFHHEGPIIVIDKANGKYKDKVAISWNIIGNSVIRDNRISIRNDPTPAEMFLVTNVDPTNQLAPTLISNNQNSTSIIIQPKIETDELQLITIFLTREWVGAIVQISESSQGSTLVIRNQDTRIDVDIAVP